MTKEILATNIDGFLIKHEAFIEPHKAWFDKAIEITGDKSLEQWKGHPEYWKGVDSAMKQIMPKGTDKQRDLQARHWYQESVVFYIEEHPDVVYKEAVDTLRRLKQRFTLALITTNTKEYINQILEAASLSDLYDIIFASSASERPDKASLFRKFSDKYGAPKIYAAARSKEAFEECLKIGSICIYSSWDESDPEIEKIVKQTITTPSELESQI